MYRLLLLGLAAVIVKVGLVLAFGVDLTWLQAIVVTILAQTFAFMFSDMQSVNIGVIRTKEDDEE